jgi:hypothetical protein
MYVCRLMRREQDRKFAAPFAGAVCREICGHLDGKRERERGGEIH